MKRKSRNTLLKLLCVPAVVALAVAIYIFMLRSPLKHDAVVHIARGESVTSVAWRLQKSGVISSARVFKLAVRGQGGGIQSGEYEIPAGTGTWHIVRMLARGDVATTTVVIPEGLTIKQIKTLLLNSANLTGPVECADANSDAPVCNLRDGDVFPDTYRVAKGTSRLALLDLANKKMRRIEDAWRRSGRIAPAPLKTWNDVVTLASIVQKETPRAAEMPVVASVYVNRLRKNMRLQADPTVVYALTDGLGDMQGGALLRGHLKVDSPYNTYMHGGLPPAPIANVGQAAIRAVLKPADTNYLFFVADGRGGHHFSNSYEQHMRHHATWREIKKVKDL